MTTTITRLTADRKALIAGLNTVIPAAAPRGTSLPVLAGVRLRAEKGKLRLTATNLELTIDHRIPVQDMPDDLDLVVNARLLRKILGVAQGEITIERTDDAGLAVKWGRTAASLVSLPADEFPRSVAVTGDNIIFSALDVEKIRKIANFASNDDARPILTGLRFSNSYPRGVAGTDSYRLGVAELSTEFPRDFLMPSIVARHLPMRLLDTEEIHATVGDREILLSFGETSIKSTLIEGDFPPIERLVPATSPCNITFNRDELARAVRTSAVLYESTEPVRFVFDPAAKTATLRLARSDVGTIDTDVDFRTDGNVPPESCAFNPIYLGQLLESLTCEDLTLEITSSLKPVLVREGPWTLIIMPVRVS